MAYKLHSNFDKIKQVLRSGNLNCDAGWVGKQNPPKKSAKANIEDEAGIRTILGFKIEDILRIIS